MNTGENIKLPSHNRVSSVNISLLLPTSKKDSGVAGKR